MKKTKFSPFDPSSFGNITKCLSQRTTLLLAVAFPLIGAIPAMGAAINIMTNGTSLNSAINWSLGAAPNSSGNIAYGTDLLLASPSNNLTVSSTAIDAESWNVTNGSSYTVTQATNNYGPVLRMGNNTNAPLFDQPFMNPVSVVSNDLVFLTNNSSLTIYPTNIPAQGASGINLTMQLRQSGNFNISSGSTLAINTAIAAAGANSGHAGLTINGGGLSILGGSNTYTGGITVNAGTLQCGTNSVLPASGGITVSGGTLDLQTFSQTVAAVTNNGGSIIGNGGTLFGSSYTMTGGAAGTSSMSVSANLAGTGGLTMTGTNATLTLSGTNTYSGSTTIVYGTSQVNGVQALSGSSTLKTGGSDTYNGTLNLATADNGYTMNQLSIGGIIFFTGPSLGSSTLTFTNGGALTGTTEKKVSVATNTTVVVNGPTFDLIGSTGNNNRQFQLVVNGAMTFNALIDDNASGGSAGNVGYLNNIGSGLVTLNNNNTYGGATTNAAGTLLVNGSVAGTGVTVNGGTLGGAGIITSPVFVNTNGTFAPGGVSSIGTLTINNSLDLAGNVFIKINKGLSPAQSNDLTSVSGTLSTAGNIGTAIVTVTNVGGTALAMGDKFKIFNQAVSGGSALIVGGTMPSGLAWSNNLATDGTIYVVTAPSPPTLGVSQAGNVLNFSWSVPNFNFKLQSQTHSLAVGLSTNWSDYPGGYSSPVSMIINPTNQTRFFRLVLQ